MIEKRLVYLLVVVLAVLLPVSGFAGDKKEKEWQFMVEPYLMAPYISGDTSLHTSSLSALNINNAKVDITPGDIIDNLEMAGMIHMEAKYKQRYGVIFDFSFMDLEMVTDTPRPSTGSFVTGVKQTVFEVHGFKRFRMSGWDLDVFGGFRRWKNKVWVVKTPGIIGEISRQRDENWVDAIVGARVFYDINQDWQFMARADIGGFGLESDFTSKTAVGVSYKISDLLTLDLQYNALWVDYETGEFNTPSYFAYDTVTHGPVIGLIFNF